MRCSNNLKQIALSFLNYHDIHKAFPCAITYGDDGTAMHSWRVLILPYLESSGFYSAYNLKEPWNGSGPQIWDVVQIVLLPRRQVV